MRLDGEDFYWWISMAAFGYFLYVAECINIDSRLTVVKSDCYERIAIGQRINEKNVSRKTASKTFTECQVECTSDAEKCKAFSYGVGVKGNATCEITSSIIKESTNGNIEGTVDDTDYDLYVKKMDCKFALDVQPDIGIIAAELPTSSTLEDHQTSEELYHHSSPDTDIPLPFNPDYKTKRRPDTYKKQHDYFGLEHKQGPNRKQDDEAFDESNFSDFASAISYNRYEKPERLDDKKNRVPYDYIGSNGPPRGYGYSNIPENKPKPIALDDQHDYNPNTFDYNIKKPSFRPYDNPKPNNNAGYGTTSTSTHSTFQDPDNPNYPITPQKRPQTSFGSSDFGYPSGKPHEVGYVSPNRRPYFSSVRPVMEHTADYGMNPKRPNFGFLGGVYEFSNGEYRPYGSGGNSLGNIYSPKYPHQKPSFDEEYRPYEELIASYLTEIKDGIREIDNCKDDLNSLLVSYEENELTEEGEHPALELRMIAHLGILKQAKKMVDKSNQMLGSLAVGDNVLIGISEFDRGRGDPAIEENEGKFKVGTKHGIINTWLERNSLQTTSFNKIQISDVPNNVFNIRTLVRMDSVGSGQGYQRCNCTRGCNTNKCKCVKNKYSCNSACHAGKSCNNHD